MLTTYSILRRGGDFNKKILVKISRIFTDQNDVKNLLIVNTWIKLESSNAMLSARAAAQITPPGDPNRSLLGHGLVGRSALCEFLHLLTCQTRDLDNCV